MLQMHAGQEVSSAQELLTCGPGLDEDAPVETSVTDLPLPGQG